MMSYILDPTTHQINLSADTIDAGRLITLARQLDARECKGALGDDNQNGWFGLKPTWVFRLSVGADEYKAIVVKLCDFGGRQDAFSVVLDPLNKCEATLPAFDRGHEAYCKHTGSQLRDCLFQINFRDAAEEVWLHAKWLDTSLLRWMIRPLDRNEIIQNAEDQCHGFSARCTPAELQAMIKEQVDQEISRWINPAYRVFFVCQGHVFRVDRSGPELVLVPEDQK